MIQVKDGKGTQRNLPQTGVLSDGRTVSNYHCLSADILKAEGWLPVEEVKPKYDPAIEQLTGPAEAILKDKVVLTWTAEPLPKPEPGEIEQITSRLGKIEDVLVEKKIITTEEKISLSDSR